MNFKNDFTIKNVNMSGGEFVTQFEKLLRRSIHYTRLYLILMYDKYYELKEDLTSLKVGLMSDDTKEKIKEYEIQMKNYKEFIKQLNNFSILEANSKTLNDRLEIMNEFNNIVDGWWMKKK